MDGRSKELTDEYISELLRHSGIPATTENIAAKREYLEYRRISRHSKEAHRKAHKCETEGCDTIITGRARFCDACRNARKHIHHDRESEDCGGLGAKEVEIIEGIPESMKYTYEDEVAIGKQIIYGILHDSPWGFRSAPDAPSDRGVEWDKYHVMMGATIPQFLRG